MAEFQLIQERYISGQGILRTPSDIKKRRLCVLYSYVVRRPKSEYLNLNYIPPRSRYGFLTFLRNGYVIGQGAIEYPQQSFDTVIDITAQNLIAIKCAYEGMLKSFDNLVTAQGLPVVSVVDLIKDYEYLDLAWDEVRLKCYADTAINLKLYALPLDSCDPEKDKPRKPPPPPPPPPPVPPGTPIEGIDPPYNDPENPDNVTEPYPYDEPPSPPPSVDPPGQQCVKYSFTLSVYERDPNTGQPKTVPSFQNDYIAYGEVTLQFTPSSGFQFQGVDLTTRGIVQAPGQLIDPCGEPTTTRISGSFALSYAEITNFQPI